MEKKLRNLLLKLLGLRNYLLLVSGAYIRMIWAGMLKQKYPELFFLSELIKPGFVCIDIGANVGYYSVFLSRYAGPEGRVFAVEPVPLFAGIFKSNVRKFGLDNITLHEVALGGENKKIMMGTPIIEGVFRHGLTKVIDGRSGEAAHTYEVDMRIPDELFSSLERMDYLKCDVEGYEVHLMPHFMKTLGRFKPMIQMEITGEDRRKEIFRLFQPLGYHILKLDGNALKRMSEQEALTYEGGDFYFSAS